MKKGDPGRRGDLLIVGGQGSTVKPFLPITPGY